MSNYNSKHTRDCPFEIPDNSNPLFSTLVNSGFVPKWEIFGNELGDF
jgi:hypothetical protein